MALNHTNESIIKSLASETKTTGIPVSTEPTTKKGTLGPVASNYASEQTVRYLASESDQVTTKHNDYDFNNLTTRHITSKETRRHPSNESVFVEDMTTVEMNNITQTSITKPSLTTVDQHMAGAEVADTRRDVATISQRLNSTLSQTSVLGVETTGSLSKNKMVSTISVTTDSISVTSDSNGVTNNSIWETNNPNSATPGSNTDCSSIIVIVSAISAAVVFVVVLAALLCVVKTRRKWRRKLEDERLKTDIWTMSTYNNTIINENFADYTLAPTPMPERKKGGTKWKKNSKTSKRSSANSRELIESWYSDSSRGASIRRNTFSEPNSIGKRNGRIHRQVSENSGDYRFEDGPYERGRTSTFSVGWNVKMRDKNALVNHEEPIDKSTDDFRTLNFYSSSPTNEHIFTEL